jgi:putative flippase GtrA
MTEIEGAAFAASDAGAARGDRAAVGIRRLLLSLQQPLLVRYLLVSGVLGVPASLLQLMFMLFLYRAFFGGYTRLELNLMYILNFELNFLRNFGLHCLYTWRMRPTWRRLYHAHIAAVGAFVVDITVFNVVFLFSGIVPLAQLSGGSSGVALNFTYNRLKTFSHSPQIGMKGGKPSES